MGDGDDARVVVAYVVDDGVRERGQEVAPDLVRPTPRRDARVAARVTFDREQGILAGFMPQGQELIIVPSMPGPVHSAELLASERATALFRAMRSSDERNYFICDLPPVFANDDAAIIMESLDGYMIVAQDGKTTQRELAAIVEMLGHDRLAGVVLNKYRGGLISEGYGIEDRYASEYYASRESDED